MSAEQGIRLVEESTTSPEWSVWTLYAGDLILGCVTTRPGLTEIEAQAAFRAKKANDARILDQIDRIIDA